MSAGSYSFEARDFTKGFVAALVQAGAYSLQPMNPQHRQGLYRVWGFLDRQAREAQEANARERFKALIRLRNRIAPGHTGAFDQFQTDLRDLQLSLTESPNPSYEDISFSLSAPFAKSLLMELGEERSDLVRGAVEVFLGADEALDVASVH